MKKPVKMTVTIDEVWISGEMEQVNDILQKLQEYAGAINDTLQKLQEYAGTINSGLKIDMEDGLIRLTGSKEELFLSIYFLSRRELNICLEG